MRGERVLAAHWEVCLTLAAVTAATVLISWSGRVSVLADHVQLAVAALFLWTGIHMSQRQPDGLARYGLRLGGLLDAPERAPAGAFAALTDLMQALLRALRPALRESIAGLTAAALIFPPFVLGFYLYHAPERGFELRLPADLASYTMTQLLVVALPEEALFRGYVQSRLSEIFSRRTRVLGISLSLPALILQALAFALIHVAVDPRPARLAVFFPGLLFGYVRAKRGSIGAGVVLHAACNLLSDVLVRGWL